MFGLILFAIACLGIVLAVAASVMAATDWRNETETTGPILRLRALGDEDEELRCYAAVDDGSSDWIRALRIDQDLFDELRQGDVVTVRLTRNLACVPGSSRPRCRPPRDRLVRAMRTRTE